MPKVSDTYNLYVLRPDLAKQWHPTKNGCLGPKDVTPGSSKKVWWLCENGHWWQSAVRDRTRGKHCTYCKDFKNHNRQRMVDLQPQLLKEWHPSKNRNLRVRDVLSDHKEKVWWICEQGHEWEATIRSRLTGKSCPVCLSMMPQASGTKLAGFRPHPAMGGCSPLTALRLGESPQHQGIEQRKTPRYERSAVVMIEKRHVGPLGYAHLRNFSAGGMLLRSDFAVRPGDIITIKLDLPLYPSASRAVISKVMWCRNLETPGETYPPFGIGLRLMG